MANPRIAFLVYGEAGSGRNAITEEKYKDLAAAFSAQEYEVSSVLFHDDSAVNVSEELKTFNAVLVWVNPVEKGKDRRQLDTLLTDLSLNGCFVSAHPDVIFRIGTKDILFKTKDMDWASDVKLYTGFEDFASRFLQSLLSSGIRILKQYRGNGGNGVFKIKYLADENNVSIIPAHTGNEERILSWSNFLEEFSTFFSNGGILVDQEWNKNIRNGMVRCYLSGTRVAGFGYQEINALYESVNNTYIPPGKRFYLTENCGLFRDLKEIMEIKWVPQMLNKLSISPAMLPVIWDADFFINDPGSVTTIGKYTLCEINVSSVSPFPPSSIKFIVEEVTNRMQK